MQTKEERLKELKAQREQINKEIKRLEDPSTQAGGASFRVKKNGYMAVTWKTSDEHGNLHEPTIITGFCYKGIVQELNRMAGDLNALKTELEGRIENEKDLRPRG